ncbi:MAG: hypothetical protein K1X75_06805 [Leptospirales bacterium]|nr:hypothetical protein [Leptospirales bacterium]
MKIVKYIFLSSLFSRAHAVALALLLAWSAGAAVEAQPGAAPARGGEIVIRWQALAGAAAYQLQIRRRGEEAPFVDERLRDNAFPARLTPGQYEQRLSAINQAGRQGPWSAWRELEVRASRRPVIGALQPQGASESGQLQRVTIQGLYFTPESRIIIRNQSEQQSTLVPARMTAPGVLETELDPTVLRDGKYSLVIENPREQRSELAAAVVIADDRVSVPEQYQQPSAEFRRQQQQAAQEQAADESQRQLSAPEIWTSMAPGLPALFRGEYRNSSLWGAAFLAPVGGVLLEYNAGVAARNAYKNDPLTLFVTNPALAQAVGSQAGSITNSALGLIIYQHSANQSAARATYARHQQNQIFLAGLAGVVYLLHFYLESGEALFDSWFGYQSAEAAAEFAAAASPWLSGRAISSFHDAQGTGYDELSRRSQLYQAPDNSLLSPLLLLHF